MSMNPTPKAGHHCTGRLTLVTKKSPNSWWIVQPTRASKTRQVVLRMGSHSLLEQNSSMSSSSLISIKTTQRFLRWRESSLLHTVIVVNE